MKSRSALYPVLALVTVLNGCVHSHHAPVVYEASPVYAPVSPTSESSATRVYSQPESVVVLPSTPSVVRGNDLELADRMRRMFQTDSGLAAIARNVRITVSDGKAIMTGSVLSASDRSILHRAVASTPGLSRLEDRTQVELNR
jgi:hypothetical protein